MNKLHIIKRDGMPFGKTLIIRALSLLAGLIVGGILIRSLGHNPFSVYIDMINSVVGSRLGFNETARIAIPLLGAALAVGLAFKMRFWNIGAEGQILLGGIGATYVALFHYNLPQPLLLILMALAAIVAGGVIGHRLATRFKANISWVAGVILIGVAILQLL